MPDNKAQVILHDLVDRYGPFNSSDGDRRRCRGLLRDLAGSYILEVNLILRALESGVPEQLTVGHTNLGLVTPRLARALQETHGISAENAAWSVAAWVFALGLKPGAAEPNPQQLLAATAPVLEEQQHAAAKQERLQTVPIWQQIGIELVQIPAGDFLYGDDKRRVYLPEYRIAKTPVTNLQYKTFVDATGHRAPDHWKGGKIPAGKEDHPVVYIRLDDAMAFCQWAGVALPSEQQWEKAARGTDGRKYPWGDAEPDGHRCNFNIYVGDTTPVGKYPTGTSPYGLLDMAGNVCEWCADGYTTDLARVLRGGAWWNRADWVRCEYRDRHHPDFNDDFIGFRVVSPDLAATAERRAVEKGRQEAAEQERQRAIAGAARCQQSTPIWQQIGIEVVQIPAGEFLYGDDKRLVYLPEYRIATTPVTNLQYKAFVDTTGHRAPDHWQESKMPAGKKAHPVVGVSWDDATAFCKWAGVALPNEQQWEKAARGTDGSTYPWGDAAPNRHRCNFNREIGDTTPVGNYPAGANGLFDMAGNVWEWCADWYAKDAGRVLRGGAWSSDARLVRCAYRCKGNPVYRFGNNGFRVVPPAVDPLAAG